MKPTNSEPGRVTSLPDPPRSVCERRMFVFGMMTFAGASASGVLTAGSATAEALTSDPRKRSYRTRAAFVADQGRAEGLSRGDVVTAEGFSYAYDPGATAIPDLDGFVPQSSITPEHFGWSPESDAADSTQAIDHAIAHIRSIGGGTVHFGSNIYLTTGGHIVDFDNFHLLGEGAGRSEIRLVTNATMFTFRHEDQFNGNRLNNITVSGLHLLGSNDAARSSLAFDVGVVRFFVLRNCRLGGFFRFVDMRGTNGPAWIVDNYFRGEDGFKSNTGSGGGSFVRLLPVKVAAGSKNTDEDLDDPGTHYRKCNMIIIARNDFTMWRDSIDNGFVVQSVDGLQFYDNHILRCNGSMMLLQPGTSADRLWNVQIINNHFDGSEPYTDYCLRIGPRPYKTRVVTTRGTGFGARIRIEDNQFDGAATHVISCENDETSHLRIAGNLLRNADAATWVSLRQGRGICEFSNNTILTKNGKQPKAGIVFGTEGAAGSTWQVITIDDNRLLSLDGRVPGIWIRPVGKVNAAIIKGNIFQPASDANGDGLLLDRSTAGTIQGSARTLGNKMIGDTSEEVFFTPVVADHRTAGNIGAASIAEGSSIRKGNVVTVTIRLEKIDTSSLDPKEHFWIRGLPETCAADVDRAVGSVLVRGTSFSEQPVATISGKHNEIQLVESSSGAGFRALDVAAFRDDEADVWITLTYKTD